MSPFCARPKFKPSPPFSPPYGKLMHLFLRNEGPPQKKNGLNCLPFPPPCASKSNYIPTLPFFPSGHQPSFSPFSRAHPSNHTSRAPIASFSSSPAVGSLGLKNRVILHLEWVPDAPFPPQDEYQALSPRDHACRTFLAPFPFGSSAQCSTSFFRQESIAVNLFFL